MDSTLQSALCAVVARHEHKLGDTLIQIKAELAANGTLGPHSTPVAALFSKAYGEYIIDTTHALLSQGDIWRITPEQWDQTWDFIGGFIDEVVATALSETLKAYGEDDVHYQRFVRERVQDPASWARADAEMTVAARKMAIRENNRAERNKIRIPSLIGVAGVLLGVLVTFVFDRAFLPPDGTVVTIVYSEELKQLPQAITERP